MNRIRPWLYVGKYRETLNPHLLAINKIGAMLQLAELVEQPDIATLYLDVDDGVPLPAELLRRGVDFVIAQKAQNKRVLVACGAGISRSAAFAVAALKEIEGLDLLSALRAVKQKHPHALPHPEIWASLCAYYQEDVPFSETLTDQGRQHSIPSQTKADTCYPGEDNREQLAYRITSHSPRSRARGG